MSVQRFYDQLAEDYHLIFADWDASVVRQAEMLDALIQSQMVGAATVYDCACGIGTQAIGMALRGYQVHATDLSADAVARAKREAQRLSADLTFGMADFRHLDGDSTYDVVIACDNALPHLLTDDDLALALASMRRKLNPDGLLLLSIRDYDALLLEKPQTTPVRVLNEPFRAVFQVWEWMDNLYTVHHFILLRDTPEWTTVHRETRYRALRRAELNRMLRDVGFSEVQWHMDAYYQPVVTAR
jgi:glycine/sarcosine N-methyltransferase